MPQKPIPLTPPYQNVDEIGLKNYGAKLYNGYINELGNLVGRPGLKDFCDLGTSAGVDGLTWWAEQGIAIAVSGTKTFKITANDGTNSQLTGNVFQSGTRPIFGNYGTTLYGANGAKIIAVTTTTASELADADAPQTVTHPGVLDTYLIANKTGTGQMHRSNVGAPTTWEGNYVTAEAQYDDVTALLVDNLAIQLVGSRTWESWRNDGSTPFVREYQGYIDRGTIAPYSIANCNGVYHWLDQYRQISKKVGVDAVQVSSSIDKYLAGFSQITDALGDFVVFSGRPYYLLTFKSEGKTLALDLKSNFWYEWSWWDSNNSEHDHWRGNCACISPDWNKVLIGDHSNGKIYELDDSTYQDSGATRKIEYRTASMDRGAPGVKKFTKALHFRIKRTNVAQVADSVDMTVKYRDDGKTSWSNERTVTLGDVGDTEFRKRENRFGSYFNRQWSFAITGNAALDMVEIVEDFDYGY